MSECLRYLSGRLPAAPEYHIRSMWEVPSLAMAFVCLKSTLRLKRFTISELEVPRVTCWL